MLKYKTYYMGRPAVSAPVAPYLKRSPPRSVAPWEDGTLAMCFAMLAYANTLPNGFVRTPASPLPAHALQ